MNNETKVLLLDFINMHQQTFGLTSPLTKEDQEKIKQQFKKHFNQIKDSPHFDEFMIVDIEKPGLFVSHQGAICTDFAEFMQTAIAEDPNIKDCNTYYLKHVQEDFKNINGRLAHENALYKQADENTKITVDTSTLTDDVLRSLMNRLPAEESETV